MPARGLPARGLVPERGGGSSTTRVVDVAAKDVILGSDQGERGAHVEPTAVPADSPVRREELTAGRVRRGLQYSFAFNDDALSVPPSPADLKFMASLPQAVRDNMRAVDEMALQSERRQLEVENASGTPLGNLSFQVTGVRSLGGPFVSYPGRDSALPASPAESLSRYLRTSAELTGADRRNRAISIIAQHAIDQARRRARLAVLVLDELRAGAGQSLAVDAFWVANGVAGCVISDDASELLQVKDEWNRLRAGVLEELRRLLQ